jgi:hypothetical protein
MTAAAEAEIIELAELGPEGWQDHAEAADWGDGLPLAIPTEDRVQAFLAAVAGDDAPLAPVPPRRVVPTLRSLAANAVMAGCRPEHFPVVLAAVRAMLKPEYNLHGALATTHPCGHMIVVNGPIRHAIGLNCGTGAMGPGWRANMAIGRAVSLITRNIGGARPVRMDRATQGSPAKLAFCFGENEEESPWAPLHVRRGHAAGDNVVTVMAAEGPHNINDHGSTTAEDVLTTIVGTVSVPGANTMYRAGPFALVLGPEHAATLHRDGWTIEALRERVFEGSAIPEAQVSVGNRHHYADRNQLPVNGRFYLCPGPEDIHILVAGGAGKHSAYVPSFGYTRVCSEPIRGA